MASPFLTRIESYRDPRILWPLAAGLSMLAHGIFVLGLQPWVKVTPTPNPPKAIPIQIVPIPAAPTPAPTEATPSPGRPTAPSVPPASQPTAAPASNPAPSLAPRQPLPSQPRPSQPRPSPTPISPPSTTVPAPPAPPAPAPPRPQPTPTPTGSSPPTGTTPPPVAPVTPSLPVPPTSPGLPNGQLRPLGIRPTPYGSDWPDTPPQLLSTAGITLAPWLGACGVSSGSLGVSPGTTVSMAVRVRVERDGTVSATYIDTSSGNPTLDNLVSCIGQRQLRLLPATVEGQPQTTDAYQVEIQVQF